MMASLPELRQDVNKWDNISVRVSTPEGMATIFISEHKPGYIHSIQIFIGKAGQPIRAMAEALANSVLLSISKTGINNTIEYLDGLSSDRVSRYSNNDLIAKSLPDALAIALGVYKRTTLPRRLKNYRPPKMKKRDPYES